MGNWKCPWLHAESIYPCLSWGPSSKCLKILSQIRVVPSAFRNVMKHFSCFCAFLFAAWQYFNSNSLFAAPNFLLPLIHFPLNLMKFHSPPSTLPETCWHEFKSKRLPCSHNMTFTPKFTYVYLQHYSSFQANIWTTFYLAKLQVFSCSLPCPDLVTVTLFCCHSKDVFQLGLPTFLWPPPFLPFSPSTSSLSGAVQNFQLIQLKFTSVIRDLLYCKVFLESGSTNLLQFSQSQLIIACRSFYLMRYFKQPGIVKQTIVSYFYNISILT